MCNTLIKVRRGSTSSLAPPLTPPPPQMLGHVVGAEDPRAFAAFEPASIAHDSLRNLAQAKRAEGQAASRAEKAARAAGGARRRRAELLAAEGRRPQRGRAEAEALAA